ncbi:MAG: hydroxymethylglutaryl-CoA synthase [Pseudomonadota bacterium]
MSVGIDKIGFYVPAQYIALDVIAEKRGIDPEKYSKGIGQEKISMAAHDEDVVTMAAEAAASIISEEDKNSIETVLFATETGVDQSKAAGIYMHKLLDLPTNCRVIELKQACYASTAALQIACALVARQPDKKVLVIASDISRYDLETPGEATQGAGAVAMLISSNPKIMSIEPVSGLYCEDVMDFWRPNYRETPLYDGKFSAVKYLQSLGHCWENYKSKDGQDFSKFDQFCFHLPFTRMAEKAFNHLSNANERAVEQHKIENGMIYNRVVGNCYNASLYLGLISTLENTAKDLSNQLIALFSYGSGATAEFYAGTIQEGYKSNLSKEHHKNLLKNRTALSYEEYIQYWNRIDLTEQEDYIPEIRSNSRFQLTGIKNHKRIYKDTAS